MTTDEADIVARSPAAVPEIDRGVPSGAAARPGVVRRVLAAAITGYQRLISPWLGPRCRFAPSCSEYAREAILLRGPIVGLSLAVFRVLRCQPLCAGGYDPVPLPRAARRSAARSVENSLKDSEPTDAPGASAEGASAC